MGVYIKGMEMPKNCMLCPFCVEEADPANGEMCMVTGKLMPPCTRERLDNCPLVPVPAHGDLIDRDYVKEHLYACETNGRPLHTLELCELLDAINDIPTIIPAEEGET